MKPAALLIALLCSSLISGCMQMPMPRGSYDELYPAEPRPERFDLVAAGHRVTGVRTAHRSGGPPILFIHGSPGEWQNWARYLDEPRLQRYGSLIAPDRPGFGGSAPLQGPPSLRAQSAILAALLADETEPAIIVGHSLGGALAARLALDHPDRVRGLLLVAASVAPELEAPRWYNEIGNWRWVNRRLPASMRRSNDELYPLQSQLRELEPVWAALRAPVYVLQGGRDRLVYPATADYLATQLRGNAASRVERLPEQGHFILWEQQSQVIDRLVELIEVSAR